MEHATDFTRKARITGQCLYSLTCVNSSVALGGIFVKFV